MKLLVISHFYPPLNRMASSRPLGWVQLARSLEYPVTVLTSAKNALHGPLSLQPDTSGANIVSIDVPFVSLLTRTPSSLLRKILFRLCNFLWFFRALAAILFDPRFKGFEVVISTYSPVSTILLGYAYRKLRRRCIWVVDYRDLWTGNSYRSGNRQISELVGWFSQRVMLRSANLITTVSDSLRDELKKLASNKPIAVIYNGFDSIDSSHGNDGFAIPDTDRDICRIVYTGTIYAGKRSPEPLFQAITALLRESKITREQIQLEFLGDRLGNVPELLAAYDLESCSSCPGQVSREQSYQSQREATLLLMLGSNDPGILTGKIFEYLAAARPVLALGDEPDSAVGKLLSCTGSGIAVGTDVEKIKSIISDLVVHKRFNAYAPKPAEILRYSRDAQGRKLFQKIAELQTQSQTQ